MATGGGGQGQGVRVPVYIDAANLPGNVQAAQQIIRREAMAAALKDPQGATAGPQVRTMAGQIGSPAAQLAATQLDPVRFTQQQAARASTNEQIARINAQNLRERQNNIQANRQAFAQKIMGFGVPAAIGLGGMAALGPALNIGFASMSGGPVGGGIAAASFAVGGTIRSLIRVNSALSKFQDSLATTAEGMDFITDSFREQRAAFEAIKVFQGGIAMSTRENTMEKWNKALLDNVDVMTKLNMNYQVMRSMISEVTLSLGVFGVGIVGGPDRATKSVLTGLGSLPGRATGSPFLRTAGEFVGGFFAGEAINRSRALRPGALRSINEQIRNLEEGMFTPAFTSPEQFFRRTQLNLLKPDNAKEQRAHMIKVLEQQRDALQKLVEDEKNVTGGDKFEVFRDIFNLSRGLLNITLR